MIRVIIKGKQGAGKTVLAAKFSELLKSEGVSFTVQDGEDTVVHKSGGAKPAPISVAIIVKQG
jgi:adenylylsulfate kinase-like enzyme